MDFCEIFIVMVLYNSFELIGNLLVLLWCFYLNFVYVVDGFSDEYVEVICVVVVLFEGVMLYVQGYNIYYGFGMVWVIQILLFGLVVLFLDSDIVVQCEGFIEVMLVELQFQYYGVGGVVYVNCEGFDIFYVYGVVFYLYLFCMFCNIDVMKQWFMFVKYGVFMVVFMLVLYDVGQFGLFKYLDWMFNDVMLGFSCVYIDYVGCGIVINIQGYYLDEWMVEVCVKQVVEICVVQVVVELCGYNFFVLGLILVEVCSVVEVGCSIGGLVQVFKGQCLEVCFVGLEFDFKVVELVCQCCDEVLQVDID